MTTGGSYLIMYDSFDVTYSDLNPTLLYAGKNHAQRTNPPHCHDHAEIVCVLSGNEQYYLDGEIYDVHTGDMIIINPGVMHSSIVPDESSPALVFFTGFHNFHFRDMPPNTIQMPDHQYVLHTNSQVGQDAINLCFSMVAERYSDQAGQYFMQKSYLIQLLMLVIRQIMAPPSHNSETYRFESYHKTYVVNEIRNYLNNHYTEKISLDLIAKNMYLSSAYISKMFKEETGETPINYLIKLRLEKARLQLEIDSAASVKSISNSVGYEDVYYFSKLFKKYYGMSPLKYKEKFRGIS